MAQGAIKAGLGTLIGNAGEYLVVGELLKRGVVASPAPRNTPAFDVLATNTVGTRWVNIRVKTMSVNANSWVWLDKNAKKRMITHPTDLKVEDVQIFRSLQQEGDFTVLVDLGTDDSQAQFFVIPTIELNNKVISGFLQWLRAEPKRGKPRSLGNPMLRLGHQEHRTWLTQYQSAWYQIKSHLGIN